MKHQLYGVGFHVIDGVGPLTVVEGSIIGEMYRQTLQKHFLSLVVSRHHHKKETTVRPTILVLNKIRASHILY